MSWRHVFVTEFLYGTEEDRRRFLTVLRATVLRRDDRYGVHALPSEDNVQWITWRAQDLDNSWVERHEMSDLVDALTGIMEKEVEIVAAWEWDEPAGRQRVWKIPGRDSGCKRAFMPGELVAPPRQLEQP